MPAPPPRFGEDRVRAYYERNTAAFAAYGQGGDEGVIRRPVWAPGVADVRQAVHYVDDRIADLVAVARGATARPHVVDLGCGVGASLQYLAAHGPMTGTGITLSPTQAALGRQRLAAAGLADRVTCLEGDFTRLPGGVAAADVAFAIESFVHTSAPSRFFAECARLVRPGGRLAICDDLRREPLAAERAAAAAVVDRFCRGWHVNSLLTRDELHAAAGAAGFVREATTDLTPWLRLHRPRDLALSVLAAPLDWLGARSARAASLAGGAALNRCLIRGWIAYELAVFRRAPA